MSSLKRLRRLNHTSIEHRPIELLAVVEKIFMEYGARYRPWLMQMAIEISIVIFDVNSHTYSNEQTCCSHEDGKHVKRSVAVMCAPSHSRGARVKQSFSQLGRRVHGGLGREGRLCIHACEILRRVSRGSSLGITRNRAHAFLGAAP